MLTRQMHNEALDKAKTATERYLSEHGDGFPCGSKCNTKASR